MQRAVRAAFLPRSREKPIKSIVSAIKDVLTLMRSAISLPLAVLARSRATGVINER